MKKYRCFLPILFIICSCQKNNQILETREPNVTLSQLSEEFKAPSNKYRPETWFHLNGNNISKEGLTLDLEAVKAAGLQGIHLFNKAGRPFPNVKPFQNQ